MHTRADAVPRHSPAVWGLLAVGVVAALEVVGVLAWNAFDHRDAIRAWLKM